MKTELIWKIGGLILGITLIFKLSKTAEASPVPEELELPYPEEPVDYTQTINNTDPSIAFNAWKTNYAVPVQYHSFWDNVSLVVTNQIEACSQTWQAEKKVEIRPEWCNSGVLAHELAHISQWELQKNNQWETFVNTWRQYLDHPLLSLLYYRRLVDVPDYECYPEIYRFLGHQMPGVLKPFYPYLM